MTVDEIRTVAVVDDDPNDRELLTWALEEAGMLVRSFDSPDSLENTISQIVQSCDALVSDHQLRWGGHTPFDGAQLVASCFRANVPSVLVTAYVMDSDESIRIFRDDIPVLVPRDEVDSDRIAQALQESQSELRGAPSRQRQSRPAVVRVTRVREGQSRSMVDAVVLQWNPHRNVSFPLELISRTIDVHDPQDLIERRFIADVNTAAEDAADLYFLNFRDAGPVPSDEELRQWER